MFNDTLVSFSFANEILTQYLLSHLRIDDLVPQCSQTRTQTSCKSNTR